MVEVQATEKLAAAGVRDEYLEQIRVHAVLDDDRVAHQPDCEWAPDGRELISAGELLDAIPCPDCEALNAIVGAEPRLELLEEILVARQLAEDPTTPDDPVIARSVLKNVEDERSELQLLLPGDSELDEAAEDAIAALDRRRRALTEHLRSLQGPVLQKCRETVGMSNDGPLLAAGIVGWVGRVSTNRLVDAIVAVYGYETQDGAATVVVAPEVVHEALGHSRLPRRAGALTEPVAVPQDVEPFAFVEILAGIWEPSGDGAMSELRAAVETAATLS